MDAWTKRTRLSDGTVIVREKTRRLLDVAGCLARLGQARVEVQEMNPFKTQEPQTRGQLAINDGNSDEQ